MISTVTLIWGEWAVSKPFFVWPFLLLQSEKPLNELQKMMKYQDEERQVKSLI